MCNLALRGAQTLCTRDHVHQTLRGRSKRHKQSWTRVAQAYPSGVAAAVAESLLKFGDCRRKFDPAACAKQTSLRIGEADNPGPGRKPRFRDIDLDAVPLVEYRTASLQARVWSGFEGWLRGQLSAGTVEDAFKLPALIAMFAKEYGSFLFSSGSPLHLFRHLLALLPRKIIGVKPFMSICWDHLSRWEKIEPTVHRVPIPTAVVEAMIAVSICWGWRRFAGVLGIMFYGITRPGKALNATRDLLVLPHDLLQSGFSECYLQLPEPKGRRRSKGRRTPFLAMLPETNRCFLLRLLVISGGGGLAYSGRCRSLSLLVWCPAGSGGVGPFTPFTMARRCRSSFGGCVSSTWLRWSRTYRRSLRTPSTRARVSAAAELFP